MHIVNRYLHVLDVVWLPLCVLSELVTLIIFWEPRFKGELATLEHRNAATKMKVAACDISLLENRMPVVSSTRNLRMAVVRWKRFWFVVPNCWPAAYQKSSAVVLNLSNCVIAFRRIAQLLHCFTLRLFKKQQSIQQRPERYIARNSSVRKNQGGTVGAHFPEVSPQVKPASGEKKGGARLQIVSLRIHITQTRRVCHMHSACLCESYSFEKANGEAVDISGRWSYSHWAAEKRSHRW